MRDPWAPVVSRELEMPLELDDNLSQNMRQLNSLGDMMMPNDRPSYLIPQTDSISPRLRDFARAMEMLRITGNPELQTGNKGSLQEIQPQQDEFGMLLRALRGQ